MSERKHSHYFKSVEGLQSIDVYRVLQLFSVADPCLQHAVKKLLVAGGRGGGKDISRDIQEAIDTLQRWQEMCEEEKTKGSIVVVASPRATPLTVRVGSVVLTASGRDLIVGSVNHSNSVLIEHADLIDLDEALQQAIYVEVPK